MSFQVAMSWVIPVILAGAGLSWAQAPGSTAPVARPACAPDHTEASAADKALVGRRYAEAERLYGEALAANPASDGAMAGLVRVAIGEGKLADALAMVMKDDGAHPNDAVLLDAMGEVRFRRGEVDESARAFNRSINLNPCSGLTHFDMARFMNLSGLYGSAQRQLEFAHTLAPDNPEITARWKATHAVPLTPEQTLTMLKRRLESGSLTDAQKDGINAAMKGIETREKGSCELVTPVTEAKLPIVPISNGMDPMASMYESALEVKINGKKKRLEIDTGASGLLLSNAVAKSAGLVPELRVKAGGVGDSGLANAFVTHVDDIKIGGMEFKNCMVQVLEPGNMLERMPDMDGLIGPDVFQNFLVTLDEPGSELRLGPLPLRPGDSGSQVDTLSTLEDESTPLSIADRAKDRYVAPEMKDWTPVFRSQHMLIVPTILGKTPTKLFLMDTGAQRSMISPAAAREVTQVSAFTATKIQGVSGEVQNVLVADKVSVQFANVVQITHGMDSFDFGSLSRSTGVDISGIIGFPMLRQLVISIDYRDNLVHVVYDPKKGYHPHE